MHAIFSPDKNIDNFKGGRMKPRSTEFLLLLTTLFTGLTALVVMAGWVLHIPVIVQVSPLFAPMQFNTALSILLWSFVLQTMGRHSRHLSLILTVFMVLFLLATLFEYLLNINIGIDTLFIHPFTQTKTSNLGRMAPNTALALFMIGCALFLLQKSPADVLGRYRILAIALLGITAFALGSIPLIGYSNKLETAYTWGNVTRMALHTAMCIVLLSAGILVKLWNKNINYLFFAPVIVIFGGIVITISLSLAIYTQENIFFEKLLQGKANSVSSIATAQLHDFYRALDRMGDRWGASKEISKKRLQHDIDNYLKDFPFIFMIGWADQTTQIQWLLSTKGQEKWLSYTFKTDPIIAKKIKKLLTMAQVTQGVSVSSANNHKQFFYIKPIFHGHMSDGLLVALVDLDAFFNHLLLFYPSEESFFVSIYAGKSLLFSNINSLALEENSELLNWQKNAVITNNGSTWSVTVNPSLSMFTRKNTTTPWVVLWIGIFMTGLTAATVYLRLKLQYSSKLLLEAQQLNSAILNSATYLIIATDKNGVVVLFNHYAQKMLGYREDEVVNKLTPALWHDQTEIENRAKELSQELGREISPGFTVFSTKPLLNGSETHEWTFIRKDGTTFPGLLIATILNSDSGKGMGFLGVIQDLTERKHIEQKLVKYTNDLERSNQEILLFNELSNKLQTCTTIEETYLPIKQYCQQALKVTKGILYILSKDSTQFESVIDWGYAQAQGVFSLQLEDCWALRKKKIYQAIHPEVDMPCEHMPSVIGLHPAYLCIPIQSNIGPFGLLHIEIPKEEADYIAWSKPGLINLIAEQLGLSFTSIQLRENLRLQSVKDPLTNLYNRRYLEESIKQGIANAQRRHSSFVMILIDIDFFKKINDRFGHVAGDLVLKTLSQLFIESVRKGDVACRWGGEEFLLYFKNSTLDIIHAKAENIRQAVEKLQIRYEENWIENTTISIGVAAYPHNGLTLEALLASADKALYEAKNTGRNKTVIVKKVDDFHKDSDL